MKNIGIVITLTLFLCISNQSFAQKEQCIKSFFSGKVLIPYKILNLDSINSKSLNYKKESLNKIKDIFSSKIVLSDVNILKNDSILLSFAERFIKSEASDGYNVEDYLALGTTNDLSLNRSNYYKAKNNIGKLVDSFFKEYNVINISLFYYDKKLDGEVYFYEKGYRYDGLFEFRFNYITNPIIISPIYPLSPLKKAEIKNVGIEVRESTNIFVIPIIINSEVVYNVRLITCQ